jgi:hypothetical protein
LCVRVLVRSFRSVSIVELVWAYARDSRWHTVEEVAKRVHSTDDQVRSAVSFLEKYGFANNQTDDKWLFRITLDTPSPMETALTLRNLWPRETWN